MLRFILGRSGSGKSERMLHEAAGAAREGKRVIFIIPEQSSFETERAVLKKLGAQGARKVEVVSFTRLCEHIFRETGFVSGRRLDESGRIAVMRIVLDAVKDHLDLYARHSAGTAFTSLMLSAVTEFKTRMISPESLAETNSGNAQLQKKLRETAIIYGAYEAAAEQTGLDPLNDLKHVAEKLREYNFFQGALVFVDSFKSFTPQENELLSYIMRQAQELCVALCTDTLTDKTGGTGIFSPVIKTARGLIETAKKFGVAVAAPVYLEDSPRFRRGALASVEQGIFRYDDEKFWDNEGIRIISARDPYQECAFAAAEICRLVRETGVRYKDIAIVARNFDDYRLIVADVFERYEIPVFMDRRVPVEYTPLMKFIVTAFAVILSGFRTENVMRYAKTSLTRLSVEEIADLENYGLLWDIRGKGWLTPFVANPNGFDGEMDAAAKKELERLEALRTTLISPLTDFAVACENENGREIAHAVYQLLIDTGVPQNLRILAEQMDSDGEAMVAGEQIRIWDVLMGILDEITAIAGDSGMSARRFSELFHMMISACDMGRIPQGIDEVTAGAVDRIRLQSPKVVWILGVNEGVFPQSPPSGSIFTENERRALIAAGLPMADDAEFRAVEERFLAYTAVSSASEKLYLSFFGMDLSGAAASKSEIVDEILRMFPQLKIEECELAQPLFAAQTWDSAFSCMASHYREKTLFSASLKEFFLTAKEWSGKTRTLIRAVENMDYRMDDPEISRRIFGKKMYISASKVETYHQCRFKYFCKYGLQAKQRKAAKLDALEYGKIMHYIFEKMLVRFGGSALDKLTYSQLDAEVRSLLDRYMCEFMGGWEDKSERFKYLYSRMASVAVLLLRRMGREFVQSEFEPADFELHIAARDGDIPSVLLNTRDGSVIAVEGYVDRVDVMKKDGVSYVRVVDYKTGTKSFSLNEVMYGLNLQMLIYLLTIWKNGSARYGNILPAGVLYLSSKRPKAEQGREQPDAPVFSCSGLLLEDDAVLCGMEKEVAGVFIPVKKAKDGNIKKKDSLAGLAEMGKLAVHIEKLLIKMAQSLFDGEITAQSAMEGRFCEFCEFSPVCGHEPADGGAPFFKLDRDKIFEMLREGEDVAELDATAEKRD